MMLRNVRLRWALTLALGCLALLLSAGGVLAQQLVFNGVVYSGAPPETVHTLPGVTVALYGDTDEWPENGPQVLLAEAVTDSGGVFSLVWQGPTRLYPYYHVQETDVVGAISTGALSAPPGIVRNPNTISYLDLTAGIYSGIMFWDLPGAGPTVPGPGIFLPDLVLVEIDVMPRTVQPGETATLIATVANSGATVAGRTVLEVRNEAGQRLAETPLPELVPGGRAEASCVVVFREEVEAVLLIALDPANDVPELDEENNSGRAALRVEKEKLPDLAILNVSLEPPSSPLFAWTATVTLENRGSAPAGAFVISINQGGVAASPPFLVDRLLPGVSLGASLFVPSPLLTEALVVVVDSGNWVREADEKNNASSLFLDAPSLPNLSVASLELSTPESQVGAAVSISGEVTNDGRESVGQPEAFICIVDPAVIAAGDQEGPWLQFAVSILLPALNPGATATFSAEWIPETAGTFLIWAVVDPLGVVWEADEGDNASDLPVTVRGG